jgi:CRISPR/Cas system-associated exonuclease Cas4 (RecB family)
MPNTKVVFSYSKYSTWLNCPKKYEYLYIHKLKEAASPILEHGNAIHKQMEEFLKLEGMPLPEIAKHFEKEVTEIKSSKPDIEAWWTLDAALKACGSWDKSVAWRGRIDACYVKGNTLYIVDWKTGKVREKNLEQLDVYAMMGFNLFPEVTTIIVELYYLEHGVKLTHEYARENKARLEQMWQARLRPFKEALEFPANPTALCGYCSFSKRHFDGPCHNG